MVRMQLYALAVQAKLRVPNSVCKASDQRAKEAIPLLIAINRIIAKHHIDDLSALARNQNPLNVKTMVICTQNSGLDPDNKAKMQKLYPVLDYTELTDCGHFIHMEQAEMFNSKLKEFTK